MYRLAVLSILCLAPLAALAAPPKPGYHATVTVGEPTKLDWTFVVTKQSQLKALPEWKMGDYSSTKQTYELFVPALKKEPKNGAPLLLYIAPGDDPAGFKTFEKLAKANNMYFVAPRGVGNNTPSPKRVRIVLDVLHDVRRQYEIDPDRTYIAGFSGGGRMACHVAFALPELFGGIMPICAASQLRDESWLRQRAVDRLSIALVTGQTDFNRGEVERMRHTYFTDVGVRNKCWTVAGMGHAIPGEKTQAEALEWLEEGLKHRQKLAEEWPATRFSTADRAEQAKALMSEGRKRLKQRETVYSGLMQIKGVSERWPDLDLAREARGLLVEYDSKKKKPWADDDVAEQRRFLIAQARSLDQYATGVLPQQYQKDKPKMLKVAIDAYQKIIDDSPDSDAAKEAKKRLPVLKKHLGE